MRVGGGNKNPTMNKGFFPKVNLFLHRLRQTQKVEIQHGIFYVQGIGVYFPIFLFVFHREIYAVLHSMKKFHDVFVTGWSTISASNQKSYTEHLKEGFELGF